VVIAITKIAQGEIWWADLGDPVGSYTGYRRPVVIVQGNSINQSRIGTVICVPLTSNLKWASAPGNELLSKTITGLDKDSVANASLIISIDRNFLIEKTGLLSRQKVETVLSGIDILLGR
jgi:mRNA interferase MazF